jgi:hypothetical protein
MRAKDFIIIEAKLTPGELFVQKHLDWRPAALLKKLQDRTPFVDSLGPNAKQYIPAKGEFARLKPIIDAAVKARLKDPNAPVPSIIINTEDGQSIPLSKFEKADLQTAKGQATTDVNVQPLGIGVAADPVDKTVDVATEIKQALKNNKAIQGSNLHKVILTNKVLDQAGELGKAIKQATKEITQNQIPIVKPYDDKTQKVIAIDAGEYLGILQMVHNTANFPKREAFLDFLETSDLDNMMVIFPGSQNSQLQDSYGVQNTETGHSIMISSKGGKGKTAAGAAPALSGLKIPDAMAKTRKPGNGIDFILTMQSLSVKEQPFAAMNFLNRFYPDAVPKLYKNVLPFTNEDMQMILANIAGKGNLPAKYNKIIKSKNVKARARAGGILFYATAKDLVDVFNKLQPIPDFRQTVLEVLDMNFVQIFSRVVGGKLTADVLWPGKVDGNVLLWTKAEAGNPGSAGFSFKVID